MRIFILFIIGLFSFLYADDTKEILKMIDILDKKTFSYRPISSVFNPFIAKKLKQKMNEGNDILPTDNVANTKTNYSLEVIFQNKVRINDNWYKNGDKLDSYNIIIIKNKVYLKNKNKTILLNRKSFIKVK